jgi:uncharacterized membrane protein (DUF4010 family)
MDFEPYLGLSIALASGLLVGIQREQAALAESGHEDRFFVGGIRTYPLYALGGALSTLLSKQTGVWLIGLVFAALVAPLIIAYYDDVKRERDRGVTSELAFIITYLFGVLTMSDAIIPSPAQRYLVVAATAVALTGLLSMKQPLHSFAAKISAEDIYATLKFLILAVIALPLLPNERMGPLNVLNPFQIGLMIVLMAGLGFVGYLAIRILGAGRGLALTGFVGGLVSSTVVTLSMSARARHEPNVAGACALAVVLASTVMLARIVALVAIVHVPLVKLLAIPIAAMGATSLICAIFLYRRGQSATAGDDVKFKNPFELGLALKFGLLFAAIMLAAKAAQVYFGHGGVYAASLLAGTTDVDAITLSMSDLAKGGTDPRVAATGILLAVSANTIVKSIMAIAMGGWLFGQRVALVFALTLAAGGIGAAALWV